MLLLDLAIEVVRKTALLLPHRDRALHAPTRGFAEGNQLVWSMNRKTLEHELVDQSEDGGVGAYAER